LANAVCLHYIQPRIDQFSGYETVQEGDYAILEVIDKCVDLVILDMIMEPGIDGLETYRLIHEHCKEQRAIIASGFRKPIGLEKRNA
jgi:two-component system, cell cycle sensor histidine kinase and response regulator CckA